MKTFKEFIQERIDDREHADLEKSKQRLKTLAKRYKDSK